MELLSGHPIPEGRQRHDYGPLMGWQVGQCVVCTEKECIRIKGYFERSKNWVFTQRKEAEGRVRVWRKA
jgi:hypothetical protein